MSFSIDNAIVISLPDCVARRKRLNERIGTQALGFDFEYFDAYRGDEALSSPEGVTPFRGWRLPESQNAYWRREITPGEIGCSFSHWKAWEKAWSSSNGSTLFLEDDVVFTSDFGAEVTRAAEDLSTTPWDLVYLGRNAVTPNLRNHGDRLVVPGFSYQSHAYVLSRSGIEKLLSRPLLKALIPIDEYLIAMHLPHPRSDVRAMYPPNRFVAYATKRKIAWQENLDSSIEDRDRSQNR